MSLFGETEIQRDADAYVRRGRVGGNIEQVKVLIVEDSIPRMTWFQESLIGCSVDWAHNVDLAIDLLDKIDYDVIFLDHDLLDEHYMYLLENKELTPEMLEQTGRAVARWLGERPEKSRKARVVIHSMNDAGSKSMASYLKGRRVDCVPFDQLKKRLRILK